MGVCMSAKTITAQKELHALRELQSAQKAAQDEMARVKLTHTERVAKMTEEHQAEVRELNTRISKMIQATSEENRKLQEAHMDEMRQMHERHTKEVRRIQEDHHSHMSQELLRHVEEVRKLQVEYRNQLKNLGVDMRYLSTTNRGWCGMTNMAMAKDSVLSVGGAGGGGVLEKSMTP
mmetsp:Transcript_116370/g.290597  ORF Transcript_116370/g.290597 Transcript_116370/m.290597 type:complete len:177 (-) Transcript_116370:73-603(-)